MIKDLSPEETKVSRDPKISVLVPVYNTEDLFERCLTSILDQTYSNIEVVVVSDKSPGNIAELIKPYQEKDERIIFVEHKTNQGVFHARKTGFEKSSGDYIACVDSDDYLGVDFLRRLMKKAQATQADMVCGNMVVVDEINDEKTVSFLNRPTGEMIEGPKIFATYMERARSAFHWVVLWNKLYRRELWEKASENLEIDRHFLNFEDVYHTMLLHYYANSYTSVDYEGYFYIRNINSTTSISGNSKKFKKLIDDVKFSFGLMESFLKEKGVYSDYEQFLRYWREKEVFFYQLKINSSLLSPLAKLDLVKYLKKSFDIKKIRDNIESDNVFYFCESPWSDQLESILKQVVFGEENTLAIPASLCLMGPVHDQEDEFYLLSLNEEMHNMRFPAMRMWAERVIVSESRDNLLVPENMLLAIYQLLQRSGVFSPDDLERIKKWELEMFTTMYRFHGELCSIIEAAFARGKKTIIINDLVYDNTTVSIAVESGLINCGSTLDYGDIQVIKKIEDKKDCLELSPDASLLEQEVHGKQYYPGIQMHMQRAMDYLGFVRQKSVKWQVGTDAKDEELLLRLLGSLLEKRYFGSLQNQSCLNSDFLVKPMLVGYYPVGFYLLGACLWLHKKVSLLDFGVIWVEKSLFESIRLVYAGLFGEHAADTELACVTLSLTDMLSTVFKSAHDLLRLPLFYDIKLLSPASLCAHLRVCDDIANGVREVVADFKEEFKNEDYYYDFIRKAIDVGLDFNTLDKTQTDWHKISDNDVYLSYGHCDLVEIFFKTVNKVPRLLYLHYESRDKTGTHSDWTGNNYFEDRDVVWSSRIEEYFLNPKATLGSLNALRGAKESNLITINNYLSNEMHRGIKLLVQDFMEFFAKFIPCLGDKAYGLDRPLQRLLFSELEIDKRMFRLARYRESGAQVFVFHLWKRAIEEQQSYRDSRGIRLGGVLYKTEDYLFLEGRGTYLKALFFLLYDRAEFKKRFRIKFATRPRFVMFSQKAYGFIRRIRHLGYKE